MIRKFNYTNRKRILHKDIQISLLENNGEYLFDADLSKIQAYGFPSESLVFIEAYRQTNWMRFDCGTLNTFEQQKDRPLEQFDAPEGILFRVKITAPDDTRKIIGVADKIRVSKQNQKEIEKEILLPVKPTDLGYEIYRLDLSGNHPILLINNKAGNYQDIGLSKEFLSLVYPAVLKEVLTHIIFIEQYEFDAEDIAWQNKWLLFALNFRGVGNIPDYSESEECMDWIQNVVSAFSRKMSLLSKFKSFRRGI